jgi:IS5 family transposase
VKAAKDEGVDLRQSYVRVGKHLITQQSRYAHARQFRRARRCTSKLHTILGRVTRDIERKVDHPSAETEELLALANRLYLQKRHDKGKIYSIQRSYPEVECISKGKAHKRYEFGSKVSLAVSSKGGWIVAANSCPGNPYDGHTLQSTMDQLVSMTGKEPEHIYADMNYRGHDYKGDCEVHVDSRRRGTIVRSVWRWIKRRAAIEPTIGHLKEERRMERCRLKGTEGDKLNAVLSAAGMNFSKLLTALGAFWSSLLDRLVALFDPRSPHRTVPAIAG